MSAASWAHARNVLCVRLDNLGDVLMTTPALRALRESVPGRTVTLLTSGAGAALAPLLPVVDDVIAYDAPWVKHSEADTESMLSLVDCLRRRRFDAAVICTVYSQSPLPAAMLCAAAGIERRLAHCRENPYLLLTEWIPECEPAQTVRHEVVRQLDLVAQVGAVTDDMRLALDVPSAATKWARERLTGCGLAPQAAWVLVHPGATAPSRRYPVVLWREVLRCLDAYGMGRIVLVGAESDAQSIESIRSALGVRTHALVDEGLDIARLAALIALAPVIVCNNSGPAHIAAAVGTPVVDLYAMTNPQHTPWLVPQRVLYCDVPCRFCQRSVCPMEHHACMRGIDPREVARAVISMLAEGGARTISSSRSTPTVVELLERRATALEAMH